jgi:hypothetical protein
LFALAVARPEKSLAGSVPCSETCSDNSHQVDSNRETTCLHRQIATIFDAASGGWSVDETLLDDSRRAAFVKACQKVCQDARPNDCFEELVRARKAGKLTTKATKRNRSRYDEELFAAEVAARMLQDKHQVNVDDILIDSTMLAEFDRLAAEIAPKSTAYKLRKAALRQRKSRRLRPELLGRVVEWHRTIQTMPVTQAIETLESLPTNPGVYIFRDSETYLYIGQSNNLRTRLTKHLTGSDRVALAEFLNNSLTSESTSVVLELHLFGDESPAQKTAIREAYESEMIRVRKPTLNLRP